MWHIRWGILVLLVALAVADAVGQEKADLQKRKEQLQLDIKYTNKLLSRTEEHKKSSLNELNLLNSKIDKRQQLINTILRETELIQEQIDETRDIVTSLENDLKKLKSEYGKMLYYTYKNQNRYDRLMFILSSEDFNQAYRRIKYFQQYAHHRQDQAKAIEATASTLKQHADELAETKVKKAYLIEDKEKEKIKLSVEKEEKNQLVTDLKQKEKQLRRDLTRKQKDARKLERAIARIIEEEMRKAKKKAARTGATSTKSGFALTPAELTLSKTFDSNQGKLPWPAYRGVITSTFGEHPHPTLRDIKTINNGIDIATEKGAKARAVFEGTVSAVVSIPGAHKAVIVRHGEFLSVYSNLEDVLVKMGDKLTVKQDVGTVITNREDGKTILHFEIWKGATKLNPASWIAGKK